MQMREQLLSFDPRMKEMVTASSIFYGRGKTKACCELKKVGSAGYVGRALAYFLWLPHLERKPQVIRMMVGFDMSEQQVIGLVHSQSSHRQKGGGWTFPRHIELAESFGWLHFKEHYQPLVNADRTISASDLINLALQTWQRRL